MGVLEDQNENSFPFQLYYKNIGIGVKKSLKICLIWRCFIIQRTVESLLFLLLGIGVRSAILAQPITFILRWGSPGTGDGQFD